MSDGYAWLYLERNEHTIEEYKEFFNLSSDDYSEIISCFMKSQPLFSDFNDFLKVCDFSDSREENTHEQ